MAHLFQVQKELKKRGFVVLVKEEIHDVLLNVNITNEAAMEIKTIIEELDLELPDGVKIFPMKFLSKN